MNKQITIVGLVLISFGAQADYMSGGINISENPLEQEKREQVECLATLSSGDLGDCNLFDSSLDAREIISEGETSIDAGVPELSSLNGLGLAELNDPLSSGGLTGISFRYGDSGFDEGSFSHLQSCDYVKSAIERAGLFDGYTPNKAAWDTANISVSEYSELTCLANTGSDIAETRVVGKKHVSTGQENGQKLVALSCTGSHRVVGMGQLDLYQAHCDNGVAYRAGLYSDSDSYPTIEGFNTAGIPFTYYINEPALLDYRYERFYEISAQPGSESNGSLPYSNIEIKYVVNKYRTVPIEEYDRLVPVDVAGITIFVPIPPEFTKVNHGTNDTQILSGTAYANYQGLTQVKVGCAAKTFDFNMTELRGSEQLSFSELNSLLVCNDIQLSFENLDVLSDLHWEIGYSWDGQELPVWNSYAAFLTAEASNALISNTYINALESAVSQTDNDSQALLLAISNYIVGNETFRTGLWGFLKQEGSAFGINNNGVQAEIDRLTKYHGYDDGVLILDDADLPNYWASFVFSTFAQDIGILDKLHLLDVAKNIVDVSSAGDTGTLALQLEPVLEAARKKHSDVVNKVTQFFNFIDTRSARGLLLVSGLDDLGTALEGMEN